MENVSFLWAVSIESSKLSDSNAQSIKHATKVHMDSTKMY